MAKQNKYQYVIYKGYIHKIPISKKNEERENTFDKKDIEKKKKIRINIKDYFACPKILTLQTLNAPPRL